MPIKQANGGMFGQVRHHGGNRLNRCHHLIPAAIGRNIRPSRLILGLPIGASLALALGHGASRRRGRRRQRAGNLSLFLRCTALGPRASSTFGFGRCHVSRLSRLGRRAHRTCGAHSAGLRIGAWAGEGRQCALAHDAHDRHHSPELFHDDDCKPPPHTRQRRLPVNRPACGP